MTPNPFVKHLFPPKWRTKAREQVVSLNVGHVHGPRKVRLLPDEAVVTCVVKNGGFYLEAFIRHYSQMGFRHIFLLDNGSSDRTVDIAKKHENVSVVQSRLPIGTYQGLFKRYLATHSGEGGWCLDADIDEFFDYPGSNVIGLSQFLRYLNANCFTAVVTQLLDMFSDRPLSELARNVEPDLKEAYAYYDLSGVTKVPYGTAETVAAYGRGNAIPNANVALLFGGIRKVLYGNDCLLTKHSLFLRDRRLNLFAHVHFVDNASLADVSCAMLHYKLTGNALQTAAQNREAFSSLKGYSDFIEFMTSKPGHDIKQSTAVKFRSSNELVESGFLFMSEQYRKYLRDAG